MYKQDQARIERWCDSPEKFHTVATMVLLSIRMQWVGVGTQMASVRRMGADSACLWGWKKTGWCYVRDNRAKLFERTQMYNNGEIWLDDLMRVYLKVPGLGMAKAGFLCQLLTGDGGCLDMHNVERFGLKPNVWNIRRRKDVAAQIREVDDKISLYLSLCESCGGSEKLWDEWCELLNERVSTFHNADDVSRRHYIYLLDLPGDDDDSTHT